MLQPAATRPVILTSFLLPQSLDTLSSYARDETPWGDPAYGRGVSDHYGVPQGGI